VIFNIFGFLHVILMRELSLLDQILVMNMLGERKSRVRHKFSKLIQGSKSLARIV
jgi:hypothetical protein